MRRVIWLGLAMVTLAGWAAGQGTTPAPDSVTQAKNDGQFAAGTIIPVEMSKSLDAKKAKIGDAVEARVPADVLSKGKIVVPRDSRIVGHITDVKAHSKESPDSRIGIAFDRLLVKKAGEVPLRVTLQAVARPLQLVDSPAHMNEGAGLPGAASSSAGGSGVGASMPTRSQERVAAIPLGGAAGADTDTPPPTTMAPLGPTSKGVVGMKGISLTLSGQGAVISSQTENVRLESGTQMNLRTE